MSEAAQQVKHPVVEAIEAVSPFSVSTHSPWQKKAMSVAEKHVQAWQEYAKVQRRHYVVPNAETRRGLGVALATLHDMGYLL